MKPNFALSLSFDGLRLMHRIEGGWELVGEVALDDADLTGALARLRAAGQSLSAEPMATKLLLPNEQIKYLSIDSTRTSEADVLAALDGATPYALDDLCFDFSKGGGRTYIAAVARETLDEAEAFATEHAFNPVSFVGVPDPFTYMGEPFFSTARAADGGAIERDDGPVVVIGQAVVPEAISAEEAAASEPEEAPAEEVPPVVEEAPVVEDDTETPTTIETEDTPEEGALPADPEAEPETDASAPEDEAATPEEVPMFGSRREADDDDTTEAAPMAEMVEDVATPEAEAITPEDAQDAPVFGSRRDAGATRADPPPLAVPGTADTTGPSLSGATRDDGMIAGATDPILAETPDAPEAAPAITGDAPDAVPETQAPALGASLVARRSDDAAPVPPAPEDEKSPIAAAIGAAGGMFASRRARKANAAPKEQASAPEADAERSKMTVFGARKPAKPKKVVGGKPRFLGLILTAILILLLLAVAALAAFNEETLARWFGWGQDSGTEIAATADPAAPEVAAADPNPIVEPVSGADDALGSDSGAQPVGQVLTPAEAERIYAATGVWQRAPRIPVLPRTDTAEDIAVSSGFGQAQRLLPGGLPDTGEVAGDSVIAAMVNPPPPSAVFNFGADGRVVATPEGTPTPDGILVIAGAPPLNPPTRPGTVAPEVSPLELLADIVPEDAEPVVEAAEGLVLIAGRPAIEPPVRPGTVVPAPVLPAAPAGEEGLNLIAGRPPLEPPTRPGTVAPVAVAPAEEGLTLVAGRPPLEPPVRPGTVTPTAAPVTEPTGEEGLNLIAGRPPLEPPVRPGIAAPVEEAVAPGSVGLAAFQRPDANTLRPTPRPDSVLAAAATAVPVLSPAANALRPPARPAGLAPAPEPEPTPEPEPAAAPAAPTLELSAQIAAAVEEAANRPDPFADATALAVARSLRPDTRPRNMDRIVARAAEAAQTQPVAAAVARPAQPSGRTPTTVAAAATDENAINLREINLIGVYGTASDRRALVRLANGRYQRVTVGDRLDGGQVRAIGENSIVYVKRGRNITLTVGG